MSILFKLARSSLVFNFLLRKKLSTIYRVATKIIGICHKNSGKVVEAAFYVSRGKGFIDEDLRELAHSELANFGEISSHTDRIIFLP